MADHASVAAAITAGYKQITLDRGAGAPAATRWEFTLEKHAEVLAVLATDDKRPGDRRGARLGVAQLQRAGDNQRVANGALDARALLNSLVGDTLLTVTGRPNTVLEVRDAEVLVATARSPSGQTVPIEWVQDALNRLAAEGEVEVSVASLGHRSAFVGAVLAAVEGARVVRTTPRAHVVLETTAEAGYRADVAGELNAWWQGDAAERYWLEITDRPDIGVDLHCPQRDASGNRTPGYSLIWWVQPKDIVFHYDLNERAITSWSIARGEVTEDPVVWLSHRAATRRRLGMPRAQRGWWLDLEGAYELEQPLTLVALRARGDVVREVREQLRAAHSGALYFPFMFHRDELRPMQPYLNKLPSALVERFPQLTDAVAGAPTPSRESRPSSRAVGTDYRRAWAVELPDRREPFTVDPAIVERGLRGHADTQNALADTLIAAGIAPRSPLPDEPNFDLAWNDGAVYVAEVKSITRRNEEQQLRLGLGQVLRYRAVLQAAGAPDVRAVLVPEHEPRDEAWRTLCDELDITLVSPPFEGLIETLRAPR